MNWINDISLIQIWIGYVEKMVKKHFHQKSNLTAIDSFEIFPHTGSSILYVNG